MARHMAASRVAKSRFASPSPELPVTTSSSAQDPPKRVRTRKSGTTRSQNGASPDKASQASSGQASTSSTPSLTSAPALLRHPVEEEDEEDQGGYTSNAHSRQPSDGVVPKIRLRIGQKRKSVDGDAEMEEDEDEPKRKKGKGREGSRSSSPKKTSNGYTVQYTKVSSPVGSVPEKTEWIDPYASLFPSRLPADRTASVVEEEDNDDSADDTPVEAIRDPSPALANPTSTSSADRARLASEPLTELGDETSAESRRREDGQAEAEMMDAKRAPRKKRKWLKKGEVDPDDLAAVARQRERHTMIDQAIANLDRQYKMVEDEEHVQLLDLYAELERRWNLQLEMLHKRKWATENELVISANHECRSHFETWDDTILAAQDKMKDEIEGKIRTLDAEKQTFKRKPDGYSWPRSGLGGGGWMLYDDHLMSKKNIPLVPTFLGGKVRQRTAISLRPAMLDPLSLKEDLEIYGVRQPKPRVPPPEVPVVRSTGPPDLIIPAYQPPPSDNKPFVPGTILGPLSISAPSGLPHRSDAPVNRAPPLPRPHESRHQRNDGPHRNDPPPPSHRDAYPVNSRFLPPQPPSSSTSLPQRSSGDLIRPSISSWAEPHPSSGSNTYTSRPPTGIDQRNMAPGPGPRPQNIFSRPPSTHAPVGARWGGYQPPVRPTTNSTPHPPPPSQHPRPTSGFGDRVFSLPPMHPNSTGPTIVSIGPLPPPTQRPPSPQKAAYAKGWANTPNHNPLARGQPLEIFKGPPRDHLGQLNAKVAEEELEAKARMAANGRDKTLSPIVGLGSGGGALAPEKTAAGGV